MPTSATDSTASPRRPKAGPETSGETAVMPGRRSRTSRTSSQLSIGRSDCGRGSSSTSCSTPSPARARRLTSRGASTRMWAWVPSVRSMTLACRPEISAVTNTITATPTEMPTRISRLWVRPWRRKRRAMLASIHIAQSSDIGSSPWVAARSWWPASGSGWTRTRARSPSPGSAPAPRAAFHASATGPQHGGPVAARVGVEPGVGGPRQPVVAPAGLDRGGDGHVLAHEVGLWVDPQAHVDGAARRVDGRGEVEHGGRERPHRERVGDAGGGLADLEPLEVLLVHRQQHLAGGVAGDLQQHLARRDRVARLDVAYQHGAGHGGADLRPRQVGLGLLQLLDGLKFAGPAVERLQRQACLLGCRARGDDGLRRDFHALARDQLALAKFAPAGQFAF